MANGSNLTCDAPGRWGICGRPVHVKKLGLCQGHYTQHKRGRELVPLRGDFAAGTPCEITGCDRSARRKGYCDPHSQQIKRRVDLRPVRTYRANGTASSRDHLGRKTCPRCHEAKPPEEYYPATNTVDKLGSICIRCDQSAKLVRKFRITSDDYERLLKAQDGKCAICERPESRAGWRLSVDHDHNCCPGVKTCGECVRGLLCRNCNTILGLLHDDPDHARHVIAYLERSADARQSRVHVQEAVEIRVRDPQDVG